MTIPRKSMWCIIVLMMLGCLPLQARRWDLKTNALGWGMLVANASVEYRWHPRWSFALPVSFSAWDYFTSTVKFRTLAVQPEIRYWFSGHREWFAGIHAGCAYYNYAFGGKWRTQDYDQASPALGGGLAGGCRLPVGRSGRWSIECTAGVGVYRLHYSKFYNQTNGLLAYSERKTYFGLDQLAVSLVCRLGGKNRRNLR